MRDTRSSRSRRPETWTLPILLPVLLVLVAWTPSCTQDEPSSTESAGTRVRLKAWAHAGREAERKALRDMVERFNSAEEAVAVELTLLPEGSYNRQVQAAALAGDLPDLLEFDGPFVYSYAWQGHLVPLGDGLSEAVRGRLIPSIIEQGTYDGKLYSVGMFDSGLGLYARRSLLAKAKARIPTSPGEAWSAGEFDRILAALADSDPDGDGAVLDLKLNYEGEWFTYAFSPVIQSAGGDLIDRRGAPSASGTLNAPESVAAMKKLQHWIEAGLVDPNIDDNAFVGGRVALSWVGHWEYHRYRKAVGDDLLLLPLPDFGKGSRTAQGSWNWGVTNDAHMPQALRFLEFLLEDRQVLEMTRANGAVPATTSAISASDDYGEGKPLHLFVVQLTEGYAVPRPRTPAYPVITSVFQEAFHDIAGGVDVQEALDEAAAEIDQDIRDNQGYRRPAE